MTNTEARVFRTQFLRSVFVGLCVLATIWGTASAVPGWFLVLLWAVVALNVLLGAVALVNWRGWFGATSHELEIGD